MDTDERRLAILSEPGTVVTGSVAVLKYRGRVSTPIAAGNPWIDEEISKTSVRTGNGSDRVGSGIQVLGSRE